MTANPHLPPGSKSAIASGCKCEGLHFINRYCPLHGIPAFLDEGRYGDPEARMELAKTWTHEQLLVQYSNADRLVWLLTEELAKERENRKK